MRVLIISDIHANLVALETVLAATQDQYDALWCLGDVVGYGPRPNECVELMRDQAMFCLMGNHDWATLGRPGIDVNDFNPQARSAVLWTREQLQEENRLYLDELPDNPLNPPNADTVLATHASPREPVWEYVLTPSIAMENFALFEEPICFVGHTHKPAIYRWRLHHLSDAPQDDPTFSEDELEEYDANDPPPEKESQFVATVDYLMPQDGASIVLNTSEQQRLIINPGSVGQPRDNDARAAYAIFDIEKMTLEYNRIPYEIEETQNQMRDANLPRRLIDRLSFGW
ncbi:MAG: metallophosphoesterase family protein [Chloroflexota bacterium]